MIRQSGYYWVTYKETFNDPYFAQKFIALYNKDTDDWYFPGIDSPNYTNELIILSSRLEEPNE